MSKNQLITFKDGLAESSKQLYMKNLEKLNENEPVKNLNFLKNPELVISKLERFKPNTRRSYFISICAVLGGDKNKKMLKTYTDLLVELNAEIRKNPTVNSPKMTWDDVLVKWKTLETKFDSIKCLTDRNWNSYLEFLVLSLYVLICPRRNEYQTMYITKNWSEDFPTDRNYYDVVKKQFIFNVYKTHRKDGQLILDVPTPLQNILEKAIKLRKLKLEEETPLLTNADGSNLKHLNSITRILNNIFKPLKIGSSQLRHIYVSSKFGNDIDERKRVAREMSQSAGSQAMTYTQPTPSIK
jgi:hypothetical protein